METQRIPVVGEHVIYVDPHSKDHAALVTAVWGPSCINVVYVSNDDTKQDQYGRQLEQRPTSVSHQNSYGTAHGRIWRFADEEKREYTPPLET